MKISGIQLNLEEVYGDSSEESSSDESSSEENSSDESSSEDDSSPQNNVFYAEMSQNLEGLININSEDEENFGVMQNDYGLLLNNNGKKAIVDDNSCHITENKDDKENQGNDCNYIGKRPRFEQESPVLRENINVKRNKFEENNNVNVKFCPKPRPIFISTSEKEIENYVRIQKSSEYKYPRVDESMCHSLRFWLAVKYFKKDGKQNREMCSHFDVSYGNIWRASKWKAENYKYFSPAEYERKTRRRLIENYGSKEDMEKYMPDGKHFQWPEALLKIDEEKMMKKKLIRS